MLRIKEIKDNVIDYECDCGIIGKCMIRPLSTNKTIVFDLACVECDEVKRITVVQEGSNRNDELSWALTISNEKEE